MVVESEGGSVDSDDISKSGNNGEIFKSLGIDDESGVVAGISSSFLTLKVEAGVNDLQGADVLVFVGLVRERSIDDGGVEVLGL